MLYKNKQTKNLKPIILIIKVYMQSLYILLCAFYGNYYAYLCVFIPIREFLYGVNVFIRIFYD